MSSISVKQTPSKAASGSPLLDVRIIAFAAGLFVLFYFYQETLWSMVRTWNESETFAHGFLIAPIALYLVYEIRSKLLSIEARTNWFALPLLIATGFFWWLATIVDVQILQQLCLVALIQLVTLLFFGWRVCWTLIFPLSFLYLAVPFGNGLIPPMIDMTADFVVGAIRIVGIPVYREGTYFVLPSGSWSVVSGCSGMRYLMATVTVGLLFAYMNYRSFKRRVLFMIVACIFALVANWLRAFGIVMIAHYSGMKLALGVDHYIYGWVFFGIIVFFLFWLGQFWHEPPEVYDEQRNNSDTESLAVTSRSGSVLITLALGIFAISIWPLFLYQSQSSLAALPVNPELDAITEQTDWESAENLSTSWQPEYHGHQNLVQKEFVAGLERVGLFIAWYPRQSQGAELVNARNRLVWEKDLVWKIRRGGIKPVKSSDEVDDVIETTLTSVDKRLLIWQWYWLAGRNTADPYMAKLYQALGEITGIGGGGAAVGIYTYVEPDSEKMDHGSETLARFIADNDSRIHDALMKALKKVK